MFHKWGQFLAGAFRHITHGSRTYYAWLTFLLGLMAIGGVSYVHQYREGLIVTSMRDQVMWGFYIGNFTFLVGVAAAAVVLVIPAYVYHWGPIYEIAIIGELLAISAIVMCLGFVTVDVGHPERVMHLLPVLGSPNFPRSLLSWDVLVLNLYLLLNVVIVSHILYRKFQGRKPNHHYVVPLVLISIPAAISIHTVTAFLYSGLPARPFWNASILAPRFLASAFCSGPAIIVILLQLLQRGAGLRIKNEAIWKIAELMAYAIAINLFFSMAEIFKEYYSNTHHVRHIQYLYFGLEGRHGLGLYAWTSLIANVTALVLFLIPQTRHNFTTLNVGCVLLYLGVYIEKGIGLVIPGLVPDTLGEIYSYAPSGTELRVAAGVYGLGFLVFTLLIKVAVPVALHQLQYRPQSDARGAELEGHPAPSQAAAH
jgi:molybdopterin-containing oxidoreductase family membrane subunit